MFSSNQTFRVSSQLDNIAAVIDLAVKLDDKHQMLTRRDKTVHIAYQITDDGTYCIGTGSMDDSEYKKPAEGWTDFPFDYDSAIIAGIIRQWIEKQPSPKSDYDSFDGGHGLGFVCFHPWDDEYQKSIDGLVMDHIKNPHECIVCFRPYSNFYAK